MNHILVVEDEDFLVRALKDNLTSEGYSVAVATDGEMAFDELMIEWYRVDSKAFSVGRTIGELDIRQKYEVSVIAIIKGNEKVLNPGPETMIGSGDMLVISGERPGVKRIIKEMFSAEVSGE